MTKENLWQVIVGMVVAALSTVTLKANTKNRSFGKTLYR